MAKAPPITIAPAEDVRLARRVAQMIVAGFLANRPLEKRRRILARLMGVACEFESASLTYENVYGIRSGRSLDQDRNRSETAEAARVLAAVAADLLDGAITAHRSDVRT